MYTFPLIIYIQYADPYCAMTTVCSKGGFCFDLNTLRHR